MHVELQCFNEFYFWTGIWIRDIRFKCNLLLTQVNKILKNLETKKLIKAVKSVAVSVPWLNLSNFIICALVWSAHFKNKSIGINGLLVSTGLLVPQALSFIRKFYPNSIELAQLSNSILHGVQPFCEFQNHFRF